MLNRKIIAVIQARSNSTRFPKKILKKIGKLSLIEILLKRISLSKKIDRVVVATTTSRSDNSLIQILKRNKISYFRGSEENALNRFYQAAKKFKADVIVRITADCPVIDPKVVDEVINLYLKNRADYVSNIDPPTYPDGLDVEVFSYKELRLANKYAKTKFDK